MAAANYLLFLGTTIDDEEENMSPENRDVLDIVQTLQQGGYNPILLMGETEVDHHRWSIDAPYLWQKIGGELPDYYGPQQFHEESIKVDYVVCDKVSCFLASMRGDSRVNKPNHPSDRPRDCFMQWGNTVHIPELYTDEVSEHLQEFLRRRELPSGPYRATGWLNRRFLELLQERNVTLDFRYNSPFGEGGKGINLERFALVSSQIRPQTEIVPVDMPCYYLDPVSCYILGETMSPQQHLGHIDYHVNGVIYQDTPLLLVDPEMYTANKDVFERIKKERKAEIIYVAEEERNRIPANFLVLPDQKLLLAGGIPKTKRRIEQIVGAENILETERPLDYLLSHKFGIRCFTNMIKW